MSSMPQATSLSKDLQTLHREITAPDHPSDPASTSVPVRAELIGARPSGLLKGYLHYDEGVLGPHHGILLLPEGEVCNLPEGSSIRALSGYKEDGRGVWHGFWFPRGGTLTGPLVWGWDSNTDEKQRILKHLKEEHLLQARLRTRRIMRRRLTIPLGGGAGLGILAATLLGVSIGAGIGSAAALVGAAIVTSRHKSVVNSTMKTIVAQETRKAADMPESNGIFHMFLHDKAKQAFAYLAPPGGEEGVARKIDPIDEEIVQSLMEYGVLLKQLEDAKDKEGLSDRRMVRHMATTIDEIARSFTSRPYLRRNETLKTSLLSLIRRARDEMRQVLEQQAMRDSEGLMAAISALQLQMDRHGSVGRPELVSEQKVEEPVQT